MAAGTGKKGGPGGRKACGALALDDDRGIQKGLVYAILTDEILKAWAGLSTRQYKT